MKKMVINEDTFIPLQKVSVIVPVYNSELYLEECIDSIISQSYKNIEIVLVNDGSTDKSEHICQKYKSNNVLLINQPNQGVSVARQTGVDNATGEWILFVDSDDTIPNNAIELMVRMASDVDIVAGATDRDKRHKSLLNSLSSSEYLKMLYSDNFGPSPVCKLFRRSLFTQDTVSQFRQFPSGEDLLMNLFLASLNKKNIRVCKEHIYNYRQNLNSASHSFKKSFDYCNLYFNAKKKVVKGILNCEDEIKLGVRQKIRFFYQTVWALEFNNMTEHPFVQELYSDIRKAERYNIIDRIALKESNKGILKLTYYIYRIRVRLSGRLNF